MIEKIKQRIDQLESQVDNPEVLDQRAVDIKLETLKEVLQLFDSKATESQNVVDNEVKKEILNKIIANAKEELTEDNYWTFRGMLVELSK